MSTCKFGFIGAGNMGGALASAVVKAVSKDLVAVSDKATQKAQLLASDLGCNFSDVRDVAENAEYIFLGVKPQVMKSLIYEILPILKQRTDRFILVTMAAGIEIKALKGMLGEDYPIIRIMPNTPVSVGNGMILYTPSNKVFMDEIGEFCDALKMAGRLDRIEEAQIDAASAVSGCGPAFVYMFADSIADAAVECGLPRKKALEYAAQTLLGASQMLLSSSKHPAELKDEVCSPGGSTIAGVHALEDNGFRDSVMSAVKASFHRTKELGK